MTINSEFHANLQAGKVSEAISLLVSQLVEMDIVTALPADAKGSHILTTKVNLLSGRIVNEVSPEFVSNPDYAKFLAFHTEQIDATSQLVREQLRGLQGLIENKNTDIFATKTPVVIDRPASSNTLPLPLPEPETPVQKSRITATISPTVPEPEPKVAEPKAVEPTIPAVASTPPEPTLAEFLDEPAPTLAPAEVPAPLPAAITIERITPQAKPAEPANPEPETTVPPAAATPTEVTVRREQTVRGVSEAIASAGSPDISEASTIPNRFNQVLKSAGVKEEEDVENPFAFDTAETAEIEAPHPPANLDRELIDLLNDPDEQWDEWLLEDDSIFSELSQASQEATKDKIPEMDDNWFAPPAAKSDDGILEDWEKFIPEYTDPDPATSKSQANVERFRQNLVNDPQMMNELLAELDDIEQLGEVKPKSRRDQT
jgi:hypothetical protein